MPVIPQRRTWTDYTGLALSAVDLNAMEADIANAVPNWQPNTNYTAGQGVVEPGGTIVQCNTAHTSGSTYSNTNWTAAQTGVAAALAIVFGG